VTLAKVPINMLDMTLPWIPNRSTRRSGALGLGWSNVSYEAHVVLITAVVTLPPVTFCG